LAGSTWRAAVSPRASEASIGVQGRATAFRVRARTLHPRDATSRGGQPRRFVASQGVWQSPSTGRREEAPMPGERSAAIAVHRSASSAFPTSNAVQFPADPPPSPFPGTPRLALRLGGAYICSPAKRAPGARQVPRNQRGLHSSRGPLSSVRVADGARREGGDHERVVVGTYGMTGLRPQPSTSGVPNAYDRYRQVVQRE